MYLGTQGQPSTDEELTVLSQLGVNHMSSDPPGDWTTWDRHVFAAHMERLAKFGITMDMTLMPLGSRSAFENDSSNVFLGPSKERDEEIDQLRQIRDWSAETTDGSRADLGFRPSYTVWDEVGSDSGNCLGKRCSKVKQCFYYQARRRVHNAQILVVNHALLFSDLALRAAGAQILPDYSALVLDEAHTVEAVAGDHLGLSVTSGQVDYILTRLYNDLAATSQARCCTFFSVSDDNVN